MTEHPSRIAYVMQLERQLAEVSDWVAIVRENDALKSALSGGPLGKQLRSRRRECRLTQQALADLADVGVATVVRAESGAVIDMSSAGRMADALACDLALIPRELR